MKSPLAILVGLFFCFHSVRAQSWLWIDKESNGSKNSNTVLEAMATDVFGNIYETGTYSDTAIFGADTLINNGSNGSVFLVKYNSSGNFLWVRTSILLDAASDGLANAICTDELGNVYIGGYINPPVVFGGDTLKSDQGFLVKYDRNGNMVWAKPISSAINALASDTLNNVYSTYTDSASLVKYNSSGNIIWENKSLSPGGYSEGNAIAVDNSGNTFLVGLFQKELIFGTDTVKSKWFNDTFIAKFNSGGKGLWMRDAITPGYSCSATGTSVATDNSGNAYMTGTFYDTITFGIYTFTNGTSKGNVFLVKYSPNGNIIWAEDALFKGTTGPSGAPSSVSVDNWQNIYLCGTFEDTMIMGKDTLTIPDITWEYSSPSFLFKFDSSGHALCRTCVNNWYDTYKGVVSDPLGENVYFGGTAFASDGPCEFGTYSLNGNGEDYAFLSKWTCSELNSIKNISSINSIILYPNPSNGKFTVEEQGISNEEQVIEIYNMLGQVVYQTKLHIGTTKIDLQNEPSGVYLYRVISDEGDLVSSGKLIIE